MSLPWHRIVPNMNEINFVVRFTSKQIAKAFRRIQKRTGDN
jgi:hypothetical protein